ncbi:alpha/beta fold hydrolase [Jatrophihabitans endophyticus]|uniref:alpha/beta fold hydrolase n=1 Tax=Jatrophihabitans endophyticus TaxID=1206085 RepID=UPI0019DEA2FE|nr:alpha/beta fold hydrolase [Jatrophihabitans endophyticus]MBE7189800.1 alpha/beta fold hydrolase [Jatrophihabitans endophyticus]
MRRSVLTSSVLIALAWCAAVVGPVPAESAPVSVSTSASRAGGLTVGRLTLHRCRLGVGRAAWCGSLRVPLDPGNPDAGRITVGFGWVPSTGRPQGTVVAQEGGPGYPSTGTAPDYAAMFGSLLRHRNLLVVDARGTGRSTPIDCEPLQSLPSPSPRFTAAVTACGRQLDHTFRRRGGGFVHASDLFGTAYAVGDMVRVLSALKLSKIDLYGDSYGTYFAQSFLARHSDLVRSVVLDSAYEARDLDPWYRTTVSTARRAFDEVCHRARGCRAGSSWHRIGTLAAALRRHPVSGRAVGMDDRRHHVHVGATQLVDIVNDAGYDFDPYRQLDAAARAYLNHHDAAPLLRLYAQDVGYDYSDYLAQADYYSDGLYMAVACTDYPQLFDMHSSVAGRRRELAAAIHRLPARTFAPFTTREWLSVLPYTETYTGCLTWPKPTHRALPPVPAHASMDAAHVPVLILNGELDSLTPAAGGAHIHRQIGSASRAVVAANTVHLVALDSPYGCGPSLVRRFVAHPRAHLDTACAHHLPAVRAVPKFPRTVAAARPAHGRAARRVRKLASVVVAEAGDAVVRWNYVDGRHDLGLRGGRVRYDRRGDPTLHAVRWTVDSRLSGSVRVHGRHAVGRLRVTGPGGRTYTAVVRWGAGPRAHVHIAGASLHAPAP